MLRYPGYQNRREIHRPKPSQKRAPNTMLLILGIVVVGIKVVKKRSPGKEMWSTKEILGARTVATLGSPMSQRLKESQMLIRKKARTVATLRSPMSQRQEWEEKLKKEIDPSAKGIKPGFIATKSTRHSGWQLQW
jgi:hypothetical protein